MFSCEKKKEKKWMMLAYRKTTTHFNSLCKMGWTLDICQKFVQNFELKKLRHSVKPSKVGKR